MRATAAPDAQRSTSGAANVRQAQALEVERTGVAAPVGLAYSSVSTSFYAVDASPGGTSTDVVRLVPFNLSPVSDRAGSARIPAAVNDPIDVAFDVRRDRLLLLDDAGRLLEVRANANGDLDPTTLVRSDALRLDLRDAQGMAVDPASGVVFILDAGASRILRIEPDADGSLDAASVSDVDLPSSGVSGVRGLAFDPSTGNLHLGSAQGLAELTTSGALVTRRDLSGLGLGKLDGMAFAPSGDQTDDPAQLSVYVADSGGAQRSGQIVELSLAPQAAAAAAVTSTLVNTVDTSLLSPPSPDPSGITYVAADDKLVISDGEVEETVNGITHFVNANVWELSRGGSKLRSANISNIPPTVVPLTNEPAGVAFNPTNGHYYLTADGAKKVFDLNPGADGLVGTAGDTWTFFSTVANGNDNGDPEGITYNTFNGRLYVADGVNREIYEYETNGTLVNHFDVLRYGINDPESVEFNPVSGTLFTLSQDSLIVETATDGSLLGSVDVSASGGLKHAGLAYAPASSGVVGAKSFYIVDRGIDNNVDPDIIDGKLFEMSAPTPTPPVNAPPVVGAGSDQAAILPASATLDGNVSDDGNPIPPGAVTVTWTQVSGPGTVTFANASAVDTSASVPIPGIYVVRLIANDSQFTAFDDVTLTFSGSGSVQSVEIRVTVGADDAEESTTNAVQIGNADLDMMTADEQNLVVGTRFRAVAIPPGASITSAYLQFKADEAHSDPTSLTIKGHAADNPPAFANINGNISSRPTTAASAAWSPAPWLAVGDTGLAQRASNLTGIIQEIVNRPGWTSGNSLVLIVTGSGRRVGVAYNANPADAPLLHVEWAVGSGNNAPVVTSGGGGATASVLPAENQTFVTDVDATDPDASDTLAYSISSGADMAAFTIVPTTGVLTFMNSPNSELPTDIGLDNVYDVTVSVSDGDGGSDSQAISATVQNVNEFSPQITSDGGGPTAALSRPANQTQVSDVNATDGDNEALAYSISGGADQTAFTVVPSTGTLTFVSAPDFGAPTDVGADNVYDVIVSASDGSLSDTQAIAVTVTRNPGSPLYFSLFDAATVGGVTAENEDVLYLDGTTVSLSFDGSDVGLATFRIDAFSWFSTTSLLLSFDASGVVPGIPGTVDDSDVVLFTSTSLGAATAGTFSLYFDGSDVGLTTSGEDVDAVELLPSGRILVSTVNTVSVTGLSGEDEDLLEFVPTSIGPNTSGTFSLYFDGSDVALTAAGEDVDAAAVDVAGNIYLSTYSNFSVPGVNGADEDVFVFTPTSTGPTTAGTFSSTLYFDGSTFGLAANDVFAIDLP